MERITTPAMTGGLAPTDDVPSPHHRDDGKAVSEQLASFLDSTDRDLILLGVVGSTAYGLQHDSSDVDRLGIFQASTRSLLGVPGPSAREETFVSNDPDVTVQEIGKFFRLAMRANPTVTELLWLEQYEVLTETGSSIVNARSKFLSEASVRSAYVGYATEQAKRVAMRAELGVEGFAAGGASRVAKHGRHCARLLISARELLSTGELTLDVSVHRDQIFTVGELAANDPDKFNAYFQAQREQLNNINAVLPSHVEADTLNRLLVDIRVRQLNDRHLTGSGS